MDVRVHRPLKAAKANFLVITFHLKNRTRTTARHRSMPTERSTYRRMWGGEGGILRLCSWLHTNYVNRQGAVILPIFSKLREHRHGRGEHEIRAQPTPWRKYLGTCTTTNVVHNYRGTISSRGYRARGMLADIGYLDLSYSNSCRLNDDHAQCALPSAPPQSRPLVRQEKIPYWTTSQCKESTFTNTKTKSNSHTHTKIFCTTTHKQHSNKPHAI